MSAFLAVVFLAVVSILAGIAIAAWQKGGYQNYWIAFWWGIATYVLFGVGLFFAYHSYVIKPAKEGITRPAKDATGKVTAEKKRPYVFFRYVSLKKPLLAGEKPVIEFVLANNGQAEANGKLWDNTFFYEIQPFKGAFKYQSSDPVSFSLAPDAVMHGELRFDFIATKEHIEALQSGIARLYFFARGEYRGEDGTIYSLPFCRRYDKDMSSSLILCPDDIKLGEDATTSRLPRGYLSIAAIKIDMFEPDKPVAFFIIWKNDGDAPITITETLAKVGIVPEIPDENYCRGFPNAAMQPITVNPRNTGVQTVSTNKGELSFEDIAAVKNGRKFFMFCGKVVYTTAGSEYSFPLCSYSTSDLTLFLNCGTKSASLRRSE